MTTSTLKKPKAAPPTPKFDPDKARIQLAEFLDAGKDVPMGHDLYMTYMAFMAWEDAQDRKKTDYAAKQGADRGVTREEAHAIFAVGALDSDEDYMLLHTRQALRLFVGRDRDPDGKVPRIPGAKNIGAALRACWLLSGTDNPYADWMLLLTEYEIDDLRQKIQAASTEGKARLERLAESGLHVSVLRSRDPARQTLGFRSPYGFMVVQLVLDFDYMVRVHKTLSNRNLISAEEERAKINGLLRPVRSLFDRVLRLQRLLAVPAYAALTREMIREPKGKQTIETVQHLSELWPGLPEGVLNRETMPRHAKPLRMVPVREQIEQASKKGLL